MSLVPALASLATACARRAALVTGLAALLALLGAWLVATRLGMDTSADNLFTATLPWVDAQARLHAAFPQNDDLLVAVISADTPEQADDSAARLATALAGDSHVSSVRRPDASPYLERNALLFLDRAPLAKLLDQTVDAQPFLGELAVDPTLRGLAGALSLLAEGVLHAQADLAPFAPALLHFHQAFTSALSEHPVPLSWQTLLAGNLSALAGPYRFVLIKPRLDPGAMQPGAAASQAVRAAASRLEFVRDGSAHVRITGSVALDDEEFATMARGAVTGLGASLALVTLWLFLAVASWRLVLPIVLTLLFGLLLTSCFAAIAVGTLNLVSVAFAVLFVGLAVDFAIQFAVSFRDARCELSDLPAAIGLAARRGGGQIVVAALASAAGFLAFTPTAFKGVAQLGLIAGMGMLVALACTVTVLPALMALLRPGAECGDVGFDWARRLDRAVIRRRRPILAASGLIAAAGLALVPRLPFDADPLHARDQSSESVATLNDMAANPITDPYTIEVLTTSPGQAAALAARIARLGTVEDALTLDSLVPDDQPAKLAMIGDAASVLLPTLAGAPRSARADAGGLRAAVRHAAALIGEAQRILPPGHPLAAIGADLRRLQDSPDATVLAASHALTRFLPAQLALLRTALSAAPTGRADVPAELARDWVTPAGLARVSVLPKPIASHDNAGLHRFVRDVTQLVPAAGGPAVTIVRSADTIIGSFRTASFLAAAGVVVILLAALRRVADVALVLAPLLMSALLTVILAVLLPLPLTFANIIALPLLLGVGVAFNVYFVMSWRTGRTHPLASPTARAVLFSALTTASAFGALSLSRHPGMASLGGLLLLGLGCTVCSTLLFLPALLAMTRRVK